MKPTSTPLCTEVVKKNTTYLQQAHVKQQVFNGKKTGLIYHACCWKCFNSESCHNSTFIKIQQVLDPYSETPSFL